MTDEQTAALFLDLDLDRTEHVIEAPQHVSLAATGLVTFDYIIVLLYLAAVLGAGCYFARQQVSVEDYFVADRQMPWMAVGLSIVATLLSTVTYLATPGEVIQHGLAASIGWMAIPIAFLIVNLYWIPFIMRLNVTSIYEYLELRFGAAARWTAVILFVAVLRFLWMAVILLTSSRAIARITLDSLSQALPWEISSDTWTLVVLLFVSILATLYTLLGGIKAVIWTDVAQFVVLLGGVVLTLGFISVRTGTGPIEWWNVATSADEQHALPPLASWDLTTRNTILFTVLNVVVWYTATFLADQVAVQRYLTTPSIKAAVRGNLVNLFGDFTMMILLSLCGMALLTYYLDPRFQTELAAGIQDPRNPQVADHVFAHFIAFGLPAGISGLVLAALFAVAMSSLDSGVNSVSTVLTVDVFNRLSPGRESAQQLRLARTITLGTGILSTVLALVMLGVPDRYNITGVAARTFNSALGPLAGLMLAGMFLPRVAQWAAVLSAWGGFLVAFCSAWGVELVWWLGLTPYDTLSEAGEHLSGLSPFLIIPVSLAATMLSAACLAALFPVADVTRGERYSFRRIISS